MPGSNQHLEIRRLGWAGVELTAEDGGLVIDLFEDASPLTPFIGEPHAPLPPASSGAADAALITHLHSDHADPAAIARALRPGGRVLRPEPGTGDDLERAGTAVAEAGLAEAGLEQVHMTAWSTLSAGPFEVTAVPAVDGLGDPQLSWVVEVAGVRLFHGGDTIFHGSWWSIARRCGPIDVAFLPVNGPVVDFPHRQPPHPLPVALDPVQAASAARVLGARLAVPIHYDTLDGPPVYAQVERPVEAFLAAAADQGVEAAVVEPGEAVEIGARGPELRAIRSSGPTAG